MQTKPEEAMPGTSSNSRLSALYVEARINDNSTTTLDNLVIVTCDTTNQTPTPQKQQEFQEKTKNTAAVQWLTSA